MQEQPVNRRTRVILSASLTVALLLLIQFGRPAPSGLWLSAFYESMHVLLFGLIALCVIVATPTHWTRTARLAFLLATILVLSLISEAAQIPTDRDASLEDLIADWLGAAGFSAIALAFVNGFARSQPKRLLLAAVGLALLGWALLPLATVSAAYIERSAVFPALVDFDTRFGKMFVRMQNAELTRQTGESAGKSNTHARIRLGDGPWPGIVMHDLYPDWSPYSELIVELENPESNVLNLNLRVDDEMHRFGEQRYNDRFNRTIELAPGRQTVRITLTDIRDAPADRQMDMTAIDGLVLFAAQKEAGRSFLIHGIHLE